MHYKSVFFPSIKIYLHLSKVIRLRGYVTLYVSLLVTLAIHFFTKSSAEEVFKRINRDKFKTFKMSRLISIIGDGNIRRNMTGLNIASRESMKKAQVIDHVAPNSFDGAFKEIRAESTVCIIAATTDLLLSGGDGGTIFATIDPILDAFRTKVYSLCTARPDLEVSYHVK